MPASKLKRYQTGEWRGVSARKKGPREDATVHSGRKGCDGESERVRKWKDLTRFAHFLTFPPARFRLVCLHERSYRSEPS